MIDSPDSLKLDSVKANWLKLLAKQRAIAIIRASSVAQGVSMAITAATGGFRLLEVAWTSNPQPVAMAQAIQSALPHCTVGAGSVLTQADLQAAITAQCKFFFTPHTDIHLIRIAQSQGLPMVAGAMTPTEIVTAWRAGSAGVKVFPISTLGSAAYIRSLQGPLGSIPLIPTGGVTSDQAPELIAAGAIAVGLSTALFIASEVHRGDWAAIEARARYLLARLQR